MACACTDKKKLDYNYVRRLANAESITKQIDIQIYYTFGFDGKTKYYDYEAANGGRRLQVVEVIQFQQPESLGILPDNEQSEIGIIDSGNGLSNIDPIIVSGINGIGSETLDMDKEIIAAVENVTGTKIRRKVSGKLDSDSGTILPIY